MLAPSSGIPDPEIRVSTHNAVLVSERNGRDQNEDCGLIVEFGPPGVQMPRLCLLLVADGMGGHAWGERLSREAVRQLAHHLIAGALERYIVPEPQHPDDRDVPTLAQAVGDAVEVTGHQLARVVGANRIAPAGTTLVAALIDGCQVAYGHLGDSRLYRFCNATRKLIQLTDDHSVVAAMVRAGVLASEVARHHSSRSQLEFYAGSEHLPTIEPHTVTCQPGDVILACTDGVSAEFLPEELARCFVDEEGRLLPLSAVAAALIGQARTAGATDNQTVGLVRLTSGGQEDTTP